MDTVELNDRIMHAHDRLIDSGAHYVIDSVAELIGVIDDIERRLQNGERPWYTHLMLICQLRYLHMMDKSMQKYPFMGMTCPYKEICPSCECICWNENNYGLSI